MAIKQRYQNPVVGDTLILPMWAYNSNNPSDFYSIEKVDIYYLDQAEKSESNPEGARLVETLAYDDIVHDDTGRYHVSISLDDTKYVIGHYRDVWSVIVKENEPVAPVDQAFEVYSDLWYTSPTPIVYDFSFVFRPNKLRQGAKRYLIIEINPNVPSSSDLAKYYENLAISSSMLISIEQACGDCLPKEEDLRLVVDKDPVEIREKTVGYYFLDTTEMDCGMYNVWFSLKLGESTYVSEKQQLQIFP